MSSRPATAPIRREGQPAAEFQAWPGNEWSAPRGLSKHRAHSAKVKSALGGKQKAAALVPGAPAFDEYELQPAEGRKWARPLKLSFTMNQSKIVIGRSDACDIKLDSSSCTREDLKAISREHCSIVIDDYGTMKITDHSGNGTLVNDLLIKKGDMVAGKKPGIPGLNEGKKQQHPLTCPLAVGDSVTFGAHASACKYTLTINTQRP